MLETDIANTSTEPGDIVLLKCGEYGVIGRLAVYFAMTENYSFKSPIAYSLDRKLYEKEEQTLNSRATHIFVGEEALKRLIEKFENGIYRLDVATVTNLKHFFDRTLNLIMENHQEHYSRVETMIRNSGIDEFLERYYNGKIIPAKRDLEVA